MIVSAITIKNLADYLKLDFESLTEEETAELSTFLSSAKAFISEYTGLNSEEIDGHETFVIAVYVLVQDMYDNRSYYVDKNNLSQVVEHILNSYKLGGTKNAN